MKVKAKLKKGNVSVKVLAKSPMLGKEEAKIKKSKVEFITHMTAKVNGKTVWKLQQVLSCLRIHICNSCLMPKKLVLKKVISQKYLGLIQMVKLKLVERKSNRFSSLKVFSENIFRKDLSL